MTTRRGFDAQRTRRLVRGLGWLNAAVVAAAATLAVLALASGAHAEGPIEAAESAGGVGMGLVAAALATGLAALGAGHAVAVVGAASVGAMAERPELAARALIFVGLAEGIAIYGLIISVLILGRL
jgi:V/A-type H+-transporting ATPase subunit K